MEGVGEEGERRRWANRHSPQGELAVAGHLPLEVEQGRQGHQMQKVWFGIQGEGLANHHPVEEVEEEVGSLTEIGRVDWLKALTQFGYITRPKF